MKILLGPDNSVQFGFHPSEIKTALGLLKLMTANTNKNPSTMRDFS